MYHPGNECACDVKVKIHLDLHQTVDLCPLKGPCSFTAIAGVVYRTDSQSRSCPCRYCRHDTDYRYDSGRGSIAFGVGDPMDFDHVLDHDYDYYNHGHNRDHERRRSQFTEQRYTWSEDTTYKIKVSLDSSNLHLTQQLLPMTPGNPSIAGVYPPMADSDLTLDTVLNVSPDAIPLTDQINAIRITQMTAANGPSLDLENVQAIDPFKITNLGILPNTLNQYYPLDTTESTYIPGFSPIKVTADLTPRYPGSVLAIAYGHIPTTEIEL